MNQSFDYTKIKQDFPLLHKNELVYLDSGATSQKPSKVIEAVNNFYQSENANVHRGVYRLSETATTSYESVRRKTAEFLGGVSPEEIIFTRGTTDSINLIASSWCRKNLKEGDEILLTIAEHHSNIVPWQIAASQVGATVRFLPLDKDFRIDLDEAKKYFSSKTRIFSCAHVSNVLGTIHPIKDLIALAKTVGAVTVIDGAQGVPHLSVDVREIGCDFYVFSAHKMLGPTGVGVLYGKSDMLAELPPYQGGGDMIEQVTVQGSTWNKVPYKFEAGTPNIAGVIGLGAAIDYLASIDRKKALAHDQSLGCKFFDGIKDNKNIDVFHDGGSDWVGVVTFFHKIVHPHDMAAIADSAGVCLRAGHHCAQPLMTHLGVPATSRISPFIYNTERDIDKALEVISQAEKMFL